MRAAERVSAVRAVADELEVQNPSSHHHDDSSVAKAITENFKWNVAVPQSVEAKVAKGWVTLSGVVDSNYEREAAARAVSYHAGVRTDGGAVTLYGNLHSLDEMRTARQKGAA